MKRHWISLVACVALGSACKKDPVKSDTGSQGDVGEDIDHCAVYVETRAACIAAFGGDPGDYGLDAATWCADDDGSLDDAYDCHAEAWEAGDCETVDGYNAALNATESCAAL